jgi:hypothetical protein
LYTLKDRLGKDIVPGAFIVYAAGGSSSVSLNYAKVTDVPSKKEEYWAVYPGRADDSGTVHAAGLKATRPVYRVKAQPWDAATDAPAQDVVWGYDANGQYGKCGYKDSRAVTLTYNDRIAVIG